MTNAVLLSKKDHADLAVNPARAPKFGDNIMSAMTFPDEFRNLQHHFPIFFFKDDAADTFHPLALFGFTAQENLFLTDDNGWAARYLPLMLDIQPFIIGREKEDSDAGRVFIDLDSPRLSKDATQGVRLFDETGMQTPYMETMVAKLEMLHQGIQRGKAYIEWLKKYDLLEPFVLDVELADGSNNRLMGFHTINEEKLQKMEPAAEKEMMTKGYAMPTFMVLASLSSMADLIERKNRQLVERKDG